ncbi:MAG: Gfo/Idh/MocA family oxidoreductase [Promethearchaeota archaeon]
MIKIGMIGLDTSHCGAFTKLINKNSKLKNKFKIVSAFPGGTKDFSKSFSRVEGFKKEVMRYGVEIIDDIEKVAEISDAFLLESVDGRQHYEQFEILAKYGKPVFIDKPFTCSYRDAEKIVELSQKYHAPIFSCSSLRYYNGVHNATAGQDLNLLEVSGPIPILVDYPGFFWYGIHSVEILFHLMRASRSGQNLKCISIEAKSGLEGINLNNPDKEKLVKRLETAHVDTIISEWRYNSPEDKGDNLVHYQDSVKVGLISGYRYKGVKSEWSFRAFTNEKFFQNIARNKPTGYSLMMPYILKFFETGIADVEIAETLEIIKFIEGVHESLAKKQKVMLN